MIFWGKSQDNFIVNAAENKHISFFLNPKFYPTPISFK